MVDATDLKSVALGRGGSSPPAGIPSACGCGRSKGGLRCRSCASRPLGAFITNQSPTRARGPARHSISPTDPGRSAQCPTSPSPASSSTLRPAIPDDRGAVQVQGIVLAGTGYKPCPATYHRVGCRTRDLPFAVAGLFSGLRFQSTTRLFQIIGRCIAGGVVAAHDRPPSWHSHSTSPDTRLTEAADRVPIPTG